MPLLHGVLVLALLGAGLAVPVGASSADKPVIYVVKRGDTLSEIALRYQVSIAQVRQWNHLRNDRIFKGQQLELWPHSPPGQYTVRSGDTLSEIAARFSLSIAQLRRLNNLSRDRIHPGQKLRLRKPQTPASIPGTYRVKAGDTLSKIAQIYGSSIRRLKDLNHLESDTISAGQILRLAAPPPDEDPTEYIVRKGDTLSEIAQRFEVGLSFLLQLNHLKNDRIRPGQKLKLRPTELDEGVHVVHAGETLSGIALRYQIPLDQLRERNGIEGSKILVGQKLRLKPASTATHMVERGDALWEIARAYGMTVDELKELNGLTSNRIYPGQELKLNVKKAERFEVYVVGKGDYLGRIARLHQMSVAEVKKLNNRRGSVIHPGDRLKVRPLLGRGTEWLKISEIDWNALQITLGGVRKISTDNGPYYYARPQAGHQKHARYYEGNSRSPLRTYKQARKLWQAFEREVDRLGRLSNTLEGWHIVVDPGHGGLDPGTIVRTLDGNGNKLYVVEDEYMYDTAMRVYVLLRLHGARVTTTLLSPNHLTRHTSPPTQTFVNEKNEVYNSYALNKSNNRRSWPRSGNLTSRVRIAREAFEKTPKSRRIFLSFHADNDPRAPEAPLVLYYESKKGRRRDLPSRNFARAMLPALGAGARARGQDLGVLRNNPASVKVLLEIRNLAYTNNIWALRFEQYRHRDAEKVVKGILDYVRHQQRSARR